MQAKFSISKLILGMTVLFIPGRILSQQQTTTLDSVEMVLVTGGTFQMGGIGQFKNGEPVHSVTVNSFYMGKYELTIGQFSQFINETGFQTDAQKKGFSYAFAPPKLMPKIQGVDWRCDAQGKERTKSEYNYPVIHVSWNDANEYCKWLSQKTGQKYRLPTEAEWEYAAGNGAKHTMFSWGDNVPAGKNGGNVADESFNRMIKQYFAWSIVNGYNDGYIWISPVGSFNPNELGLFDMSGNVLEWCNDFYEKNYYKISPSNNPQGPSSGKTRIIRGGCWVDNLDGCRIVSRGGNDPTLSIYNCGFRIVRTD